MTNFIKSQKEKYGYGVIGESILRRNSLKKNDWLKNISMEPPTHNEWLIYCLLRNEPLNQKIIVEGFKDGTIKRDDIKLLLKTMVDDNKIKQTDGHKGVYSLTIQSKKLFDYTSEEIGSAKDIPELINIVTKHYISKGIFISTAPQKVKKGKLRTDFVAFDYSTESSISIEIESDIEVKSHPEHVKLNMKKWADMGFSECHVWSKNNTIQTIHDGLSDEEKENVKIFIVP